MDPTAIFFKIRAVVFGMSCASAVVQHSPADSWFPVATMILSLVWTTLLCIEASVRYDVSESTQREWPFLC